jgi:hypothetical protein
LRHAEKQKKTEKNTKKARNLLFCTYRPKGPKEREKMKTKIANNIEAHREFWKNVAKENGWYREPFYIQVWTNKDGLITDSIYLPKDATMDFYAEDLEENED